jgi:hypothetical protein
MPSMVSVVAEFCMFPGGCTVGRKNNVLVAYLMGFFHRHNDLAEWVLLIITAECNSLKRQHIIFMKCTIEWHTTPAIREWDERPSVADQQMRVPAATPLSQRCYENSTLGDDGHKPKYAVNPIMRTNYAKTHLSRPSQRPYVQTRQSLRFLFG